MVKNRKNGRDNVKVVPELGANAKGEQQGGIPVEMTDTFTSIHNTDKKREKKFLPTFQVNSSLMKKGKQNAIFMHCLPAKRGKEVTSSVIDGPQSAVGDQAENRLHTQKALLVFLIHA